MSDYNRTAINLEAKWEGVTMQIDTQYAEPLIWSTCFLISSVGIAILMLCIGRLYRIIKTT